MGTAQGAWWWWWWGGAASGLLPEHNGEGHDVSEAGMPKRDMELNVTFPATLLASWAAHGIH